MLSMLSIVRSRGALTRRFVPKTYFSWIHDGLELVDELLSCAGVVLAAASSRS